MKQKIITILMLISCLGMLFGNINIQIKGETKPHILKETTLASVPYVELEEFCSVFKAVCKQDRTDNRLYLNIYDEQFIFLERSSYYTLKAVSYNMNYPLQRKGERLYLPSTFVNEHLHTHFPAQVKLKGNTLQISKPIDNSVKTIVLDPGHGGKDPGAVGRKLRANEKDINLAVAQKLKVLLEKELGITVLLTREDDRFVSLYDRTRFANEKKADLFISIHSNSSKSTSSKGIETYYLSTAQTSDARAVEALENAVVERFEGGSEAKKKYYDLDFILSDLLQTENLEHSNNMATSVHQNLVMGTQGIDRGVRQANFYVLRGAYMPSILVELGFISNAEEEQLLVNEEYQERLARTIFEGIKRFKFRYDRVKNT